ncbi:TetR family transcriptional regulator [Streptomyces mashuensis]|uniref:TetR family transcriptional regulator n=1 Tax=Streptomyces mashuensis TaxID=33904 RepID=A0A919AXU8_9ACTN|nr:TetR/AcrR family transcriptional regulator [Streptomyces mashuensis]GHF30087.1 TetR family transcriptional regulator [Streptomyces mashuensis]
MPKQARALRTYDRVLDAAASEFALKGYARTNLQHVADRTGLTKGAVYGHFSSKEELAGVLEHHFETVTDDLLCHARQSGAPPVDRLGSLVRSLADLFEKDVRVRAALRLTAEMPRPDGCPPPVLDGIQRDTRALLREIQDAGRLHPSLPPETVADLVVAVLFGTHYTTTACGQEGLGSRVHAMWDVLSSALLDHGAQDGPGA